MKGNQIEDIYNRYSNNSKLALQAGGQPLM